MGQVSWHTQQQHVLLPSSKQRPHSTKLPVMPSSCTPTATTSSCARWAARRQQAVGRSTAPPAQPLRAPQLALSPASHMRQRTMQR